MLKARIKADLALSREELAAARPRGQLSAARMEVLKRVAKCNISCINLRLVAKMMIHCPHAVAAWWICSTTLDFVTVEVRHFALGPHHFAFLLDSLSSYLNAIVLFRKM